MKTTKRFYVILAVLVAAFGTLGPSWAQEDALFRAIRVKGDVTAYHDENDETSRLYTSQSVDEGDKVTTASDSEAVLSIKQKAYLYLAPRTKIILRRLRQGDKGLECQVNLVTGRMLCQLDHFPQGAFEVTAGSLLFREHGTLFEISRRADELTAVSFSGALVANFHGKTKMAKDNEVLKLDQGKFRAKTHHLTHEQQGDLQAWKDLLADLSK